MDILGPEVKDLVNTNPKIAKALIKLGDNFKQKDHEIVNRVENLSGKIIDKEDLLKRKKSNTKYLLIHGDLDEVVIPTSLLEAKDFLLRANIDVQTKMIKNCGHNIPVEASSLALNFIRKNVIE